MSFSGRPPFLFRGRSPFLENLPCEPKVSVRAVDGSDPLYFLEVSIFRGPQELAETGDNSFQTMFGSWWLLMLCTDDSVKCAQWNGSSWVDRTGDARLPSALFAAPLTNPRRITGSFDQAARIIAAYQEGGSYEVDGTIKITRWDPIEGEYLQNVALSGIDPALLMQTELDFRIPGSDVWLFYRKETALDTIFWRRQADNYGIENTLFSDSGIGILDRAQALEYRYQLLVSDSSGSPLGQQLLSQLFPITLTETTTFSIFGPLAADYELIVIAKDLSVEPLSASVAGPSGAEYAEALITQEATEQAGWVVSGPNGAAYVLATIIEDLGIEQTGFVVGAPSGGAYELVVISLNLGTEQVGWSVSGPSGATYETS